MLEVRDIRGKSLEEIKYLIWRSLGSRNIAFVLLWEGDVYVITGREIREELTKEYTFEHWWEDKGMWTEYLYYIRCI